MKTLLKIFSVIMITVSFNVESEQALFAVDLRAVLEAANKPHHPMHAFAKSGAGLSEIRGLVIADNGDLLIVGSHTPGAIPLDLSSIRIAFDSGSSSGVQAPSVSIEPTTNDSFLGAEGHHYFRYTGPTSADNSFARLVTASLDVQLKIQKALNKQVGEIDFDKHIRKVALSLDCNIANPAISNMFHAIARAAVAKSDSVRVLREPPIVRVVSGQSGQGDFFQDFLHQCKKIPYSTLFKIADVDSHFLRRFDDVSAMRKVLEPSLSAVSEEYREDIIEVAEVVFMQIKEEQKHPAFKFVGPGRSASESMANVINSEIDQLMKLAEPAELSFFQRMAGVIAVFNEIEENQVNATSKQLLREFKADFYRQPVSINPLRNSIPGLAVNVSLYGGLSFESTSVKSTTFNSSGGTNSKQVGTSDPMTYEMARLGSPKEMREVVLAHRPEQRSLVFSLGSLTGKLPQNNGELGGYLQASLIDKPHAPLFIEGMMDEKGHVDFSKKSIGDQLSPWKTDFDDKSTFTGIRDSFFVSITSNNYDPEYLLYNAPIDEIARLQYSKSWYKVWDNRFELGAGAGAYLRVIEVSDDLLPGLVSYEDEALAAINLYSNYLLPLSPDGTHILFDAQYRPEPVELYRSQEDEVDDNPFRRDRPSRRVEPSSSFSSGIRFSLPVSDSLDFSSSLKLVKAENEYQYFSSGISWPINKLSFSDFGVSAYYAKQKDRDEATSGIEFIATNNVGMSIKAGFSFGDEKQFSTSIVYPLSQPTRRGRWSK